MRPPPKEAEYSARPPTAAAVAPCFNEAASQRGGILARPLQRFRCCWLRFNEAASQRGGIHLVWGVDLLD